LLEIHNLLRPLVEDCDEVAISLHKYG